MKVIPEGTHIQLVGKEHWAKKKEERSHVLTLNRPLSKAIWDLMVQEFSSNPSTLPGDFEDWLVETGWAVRTDIVELPMFDVWGAEVYPWDYVSKDVKGGKDGVHSGSAAD